MNLSTEIRSRHLYIVGQTGMGKSALLQNLMHQNLQNGDGVGVIDPHGTLAKEIVSYIPKERAHQLVYLNAEDRERPVHYNPLSDISKGHSVATDNILASFIHVFGEEAIGPRSQQVLRNSLRALLDIEGASLLCIPKLLTDKKYRESVLESTKDPFVLSYWRDQFDKYEEKFRREVISPILNKLDAFLSSPDIRNIISQPSTFNISQTMDDGRILIANLSKSELGEQNSHLLGAFLVSGIAQAAFQRETTKPFYLYVDEFQNFATGSFGTILSEARKFGLSLTVAHQFLDQLPRELRHAVFGNTGTVICFRVGAEDAPLMAAHLGWHTPEYLSDLPQFTALMRVFPDDTHLLKTDPPPKGRDTAELIENARTRFGRDRAKVERKVRQFLDS